MAINSFYSLNLNDFDGSIRTAWEELRHQNHFCDVTLACEGQQIEAHKVILSGFSPVFKNLLQQNPHPHPLLYLRGIKYCELVNMLDFIYQGQINIEQENLNNFVDICKEFQIKGLAQQTGKLHNCLKRSGGDNQNDLKTKKNKTSSFPQDSDNHQHIIKSEPNPIISENMFVDENEEDNATGNLDMDFVCDDYDCFEEDSHGDSININEKEKNIEKTKKKYKEIMTGPKPFYEMIKTPWASKSSYPPPGILILSKKFIFYFNKYSRNRSVAYYNCSLKSTGCTAKAIVTDPILRDMGEEHVEEESMHGYVLSKWSDDDGHNHDGNPGRVFAEKMMFEMIRKIGANPSADIKKLYKETLEKHQEELGDDTLWNEVIEALGRKDSSMKRLKHWRDKALENNSTNKGELKSEVSKM